MTVHAPRRLRSALLTGTSATAVALASALTTPSALADDATPADPTAADTALIMGGTGMPIPTPDYIDDINDRYIGCFDGCTTQNVFTPEQLYPVSDVKSAPFDTSVDQGVGSLDEAIETQLDAGNDATIVGFSQSATIATAEMRDLADGAAGIDADPDDLSFVLLGDPNNPNGGLLERFNVPDEDSHPSISSLGLTFSGATPSDTDFSTDVYSVEYDGFSDFPLYPLNIVADLNATVGLIFTHTQFPEFDPDRIDAAVEVPTSDGYDGDTSYFMIPTDELPLLDPVRSIPGLGPLVADLIEPDLKVLVNLGYGDPEHGWVNDDADVATPMGLSPDLDDLAKVPSLLIEGIGEGVANVAADLHDPGELFSLDNNPLVNLLDTAILPELTQQTFPIPGLQSIPEAVGSAASEFYSMLLPTVDIASALLTTLPAYDVDIFASELADGDLVDAVGLPAAVDVGLLPVAGFFEALTLGEGLFITAADLISPVVDVDAILSQVIDSLA